MHTVQAIGELVMMNRLLCNVARCLPQGQSVARIVAPCFQQQAALRAPYFRTEESYSTKAKDLRKLMPEFWIMKMKTGFAYHDVDGDGYITEKDFTAWIKEMALLFPNMNEEHKKILETKPRRLWGDLLDGAGKGPDHKVTESMYIENIFRAISKDGAEEVVRKHWLDNFDVMDVDQDGVISKAEHRLFFEARKHIDPNSAIVAFSAIDQDMDGRITRDEYVKAGMEFFLNFSDETKPSKHFFGPLVKI